MTSRFLLSKLVCLHDLCHLNGRSKVGAWQALPQKGRGGGGGPQRGILQKENSVLADFQTTDLSLEKTSASDKTWPSSQSSRLEWLNLCEVGNEGLVLSRSKSSNCSLRWSK